MMYIIMMPQIGNQVCYYATTLTTLTQRFIIFIDLQSRPLLNQIDAIEGSGKIVKVIEEVASRWEEVATRLYFEGRVIRQIRRDHNDSCEEACRAVFMAWLDGKGRRPITWEILIKVLKEAEFSETASDLEYVLMM